MKRFISEHEAMLELAFSRGDVTDELCRYHEKQVGYLQTERLAHLLVLLAMSLFVLLTSVGALVLGSYALSVVFGLLLTLLFFYVLHYYRLENAVQRWYRLSRRLERCTGHAPPGTGSESWG